MEVLGFTSALLCIMIVVIMITNNFFSGYQLMPLFIVMITLVEKEIRQKYLSYMLSARTILLFSILVIATLHNSYLGTLGLLDFSLTLVIAISVNIIINFSFFSKSNYSICIKCINNNL